MYENRTKEDFSGGLRFCSCGKVGLDPSPYMFRILGEPADYEDMSVAWPDPCPFCGSEQIEIIEWDENVHGFWVSCESCGASGPTGATDAEAVERWNNRRQERVNDVVEQLIEENREAFEKLAKEEE